jgi:hypothetical protein
MSASMCVCACSPFVLFASSRCRYLSELSVAFSCATFRQKGDRTAREEGEGEGGTREEGWDNVFGHRGCGCAACLARLCIMWSTGAGIHLCETSGSVRSEEARKTRRMCLLCGAHVWASSEFCTLWFTRSHMPTYSLAYSCTHTHTLSPPPSLSLSLSPSPSLSLS